MLLFAMFISLAPISQTASAVELPPVIINEFSITPTQWVELMNTTGASFDLSGYQINYTNVFGMFTNFINLNGVLPPSGGLLVFNLPRPLSINNGVLRVLDSNQTIIYQIAYDPNLAPASGQSAHFVEGNWSVTNTPTKGWFNNAGEDGAPPLLSALPGICAGSPCENGIISNIGSLENPSEAEGLYFEVEGLGKIIFNTAVNLTDESVVAGLLDLGNTLNIESENIGFNSGVADAMTASGATLEMYGLDNYTSEPNLVVLTDTGALINEDDLDYPELLTTWNDETNTLIFTTSHFTSFQTEAVYALSLINAGTEEFADFELAGIIGALLINKDAYDDAIAGAITAKGDELTLAEVQSQVDTVNSVRAIKTITSFDFLDLEPDVIGVIDNINHTVTLTVPLDTDVTNLIPTIIIGTGATIIPETGSGQDFTNPVIYTVTALDETTQEYTVTVQFPSDLTALVNTITTAQSRHDSATEGVLIGQYTVGSKTILQTAIDQASLITINNTQAEVDAADVTLLDALDTFDASKVVPTFENNYFIGTGLNADAGIDANGNVYVVYVNAGNLYLVKNLGSAEIIPDGGGDSKPALAVDNTGLVHIAFERNGNIVYALRNGFNDWSTQVTAVGNSPDIDIDSNGKVHIVHMNNDQYQDVIYTTNISGAFVSNLIYDGFYWYENGGKTGRYFNSPSLKIDSSGNYHITAVHHALDGGISWTDHNYYLVYSTNSGLADSSSDTFGNNSSVAQNTHSMILQNDILKSIYTVSGSLYNYPREILFAGNGPALAGVEGAYGLAYNSGGVQYVQDSGYGLSDPVIVDASGFNPVVVMDTNNRFVYYELQGDIYLATDKEINDLSVAAIVVNESQFNRSQIGTGTFEMTVVFSVDMDTTIEPTIVFEPLLSEVLVNRIGSWDGDDTYILTADIVDQNLDSTDVDVTISGAQDLDGNLLSEDNYTALFNIDLVAPLAPVIESVAGYTSSPAYGTEAEPDLEISNLNVDDLLTIYSGEDELDSMTVSTSPETLTLSELDEGTHSLSAVAIDPAGNTGSSSVVFLYTYDNTGPDVDVGSDRSANAQFTVDATATDELSGIASYLWTMENGPELGNLTFGTSDAEDTTIEADLDGMYVVRLTVEDNVGLADFAEFNLTWDTTAPELSEITPITTPTNNNTPVYTFASNEAGTISYGGGCSSETTFAVVGNNTLTLNALNDGTYSNCTIRVTDVISNQSDALYLTDFTIDTTAPVVNITAPLSNQKVKGSQLITFTNNDVNQPQCSIDNTNWVDCTSNVTTLADLVDFDDLEDGNFTLYLKDTDSLGNVGTDNEAGILKDTTAPIVNLITPVTGEKVKGSKVITFTDNEPTSAQCSINNSNWVSCISGTTLLSDLTGFNALADGLFTLYLKDTDTAGNTGTGSVLDIIKDTTAPTVIVLGTGNADYTISSGASVDLVFSESIASASRLAIQKALSSGGNKVISYVWNRSNDILTIDGNATEVTTFANDVMANVADELGNTAVDLLLIDSALESNQLTPSGGSATVSTTQKQVVIGSSQPVNVVIPNTVNDATLNFTPLLTGTSAILPAVNISSSTSVGNVEIQIPNNTTVTGVGWNGVINAPQIKLNSSVSPAPDAGMVATTSSVIEIGFDDVALIFDQAVRIKISGQAGKYIGYSRGGVFTKITTVCSADTQVAGNALVAGGDCKIDVASDLVIWTKHFTSFVSYSQTSSGGGGGSSGGGGFLFLKNATQKTIATIKGTNETTLPPTTTKTKAKTLSDIANHWAKSFIEKAQSLNYISGYSDGSFQPDKPINRAEVSKIVALRKNNLVEKTVCKEGKFKDIKCNSWFAKFVNYLVQEKIIIGYTDETFRPANNITRAEALKIVIYAKGLEKTDLTGIENTFSDVSEQDWFYDIVRIGKKYQIIQGYNDGTFAPNQSMTRAEFTKIFVNSLIDLAE